MKYFNRFNRFNRKWPPALMNRNTHTHIRGRRGAVVKGAGHISTIVLLNIRVVRVRIPLALSLGISICKNSTINT